MTSSAAKLVVMALFGLVKLASSVAKRQRRSVPDNISRPRRRSSTPVADSSGEALGKPELGAVIVPGRRTRRRDPAPES
jgi:hypothetical protein